MAGETVWSDDELRAAVFAYLEMRTLEDAGVPYSKSEFRRKLMGTSLSQRSEGSIEYRMQNISSLLQKQNQQWISGYKPAQNVGTESERRLGSIIQAALITSHPTPEPLMTLKDVVPDLGKLMGVKAVFGRLNSHVLCFGARGDINKKSYFSVAESVAKRAQVKPFIVSIGGGKNVRDGLEGRVLNLSEAGLVYGPTSLLVSDPAEVQRLQQWPVSIGLHNIWHFIGEPHLVQDLGFPDRTILEGAMDGVVGPPHAIELLWSALMNWPVEPVAAPLTANFYDSGVPTLARTFLPSKIGGAEEGEKIWTLQRKAERERWIVNEAKRLNVAKFGACTCEACDFTHSDMTMFDAHHPTPLAIGRRRTFPEHLEILCPTCHRRAHRKGKLTPYSIHELRAWNEAGRP